MKKVLEYLKYLTEGELTFSDVFLLLFNICGLICAIYLLKTNFIAGVILIPMIAPSILIKLIKIIRNID